MKLKLKPIGPLEMFHILVTLIVSFVIVLIVLTVSGRDITGIELSKIMSGAFCGAVSMAWLFPSPE